MRYFQYRHPHHALPRILMTALDAITLIRTALSEDRYGYLIRSAGPDEVYEAATFLLGELIRDEAPARDVQAEDLWGLRYRDAIETLCCAGISVRTDLAQGARDYVNLRAQWDPALRSLAKIMLYEWDEIVRP